MFAGLDTAIDSRLGVHNRTLLHNDAHFWNFLYPVDASQHRCVIFDWPLWRTGLGGCDLAYMIALHLFPEHRRRFEPVLLERYANVLNELGVDCTVADVHHDYRIGILFGVLMPVMEFSWGIPPLDWIPKLEKALCAYADLECEALLG